MVQAERKFGKQRQPAGAQPAALRCQDGKFYLYALLRWNIESYAVPVAVVQYEVIARQSAVVMEVEHELSCVSCEYRVGTSGTNLQLRHVTEGMHHGHQRRGAE